MIDERLERDLERAARPAAPEVGTLVEELVRRRARRAMVRRLQAGAVAIVVMVAAFGTFAGVDMTRQRPSPAQSPASSVCRVVVCCTGRTAARRPASHAPIDWSGRHFAPGARGQVSWCWASTMW